MVLSMVFDGVALRDDRFDAVRISAGGLANAKERGSRIVTIEQIEYAWRHLRIGAVIDRERNAIAHTFRQRSPVRPEKAASWPEARSRQRKMRSNHAAGSPGPPGVLGHRGCCGADVHRDRTRNERRGPPATRADARV
jgi:hypothetical protein